MVENIVNDEKVGSAKINAMTKQVVAEQVAGAKKKAALKEFDQDISNYEEIVIGSPIWNGAFTPAINSVLSLLDLSNKKFSFVFYSGSGEGKKAVKRINKEYPNTPYIFLKDPKKYPEELNKLD